MLIEHIVFPFVYTSTGNRILIDNIVGTPRVGYSLVFIEDGKYKVEAQTSDSDCVNGVCPVK